MLSSSLQVVGNCVKSLDVSPNKPLERLGMKPARLTRRTKRRPLSAESLGGKRLYSYDESRKP
jgi:hypothetical protein